MNNNDNSSSSNSINTIDSELLNDFFKEISDIYQKSTAAIKQLDLLLQNKATAAANTAVVAEINTIFRGVHTLKSSLHLVGLTELSLTAHSLEDVLAAIRANTFNYNESIGQILLLTLERIALAAKETIYYAPNHASSNYTARNLANIATNFYFNSLSTQVTKICCATPQERENAITQTLKILTIEDGISNTLSATSVNYTDNTNNAVNIGNISVLTAAVLYQSSTKWSKIFNDLSGVLNNMSATKPKIAAKDLIEIIMNTNRQADTIFCAQWLEKFNALMQYIHINKH